MHRHLNPRARIPEGSPRSDTVSERANTLVNARRDDDGRLERSLHGEGHLSELPVTSAPAAIATRIRRTPPLALWSGEGRERTRAGDGRTVVLLGRAPSLVRAAHEREDLGQPHLEVSRPIDTRAMRAGRARASKAAAHAPNFIGPSPVLAQARDRQKIEAVHRRGWDSDSDELDANLGSGVELLGCCEQTMKKARSLSQAAIATALEHTHARARTDASSSPRTGRRPRRRDSPSHMTPTAALRHVPWSLQTEKPTMDSTPGGTANSERVGGRGSSSGGAS